MSDIFPSIQANKTYLVKGSTLSAMMRALDEWRNLEVTPRSNGRLTRGTAKSKLELFASGGGDPKTFFCSAGGSGVNVTAGAILGVEWAGGEVSVSDGDRIYIKVLLSPEGLPEDSDAVSIVTGVGLTSTTSIAYALIGKNEGGEITPLGWNYSQMQTCGVVDGTLVVTFF